MTSPKPPPLLGLTGRAGTGKSTAAAYLEDRWAFVPIAFADPIVDMLGAMLQHVDVDGAWMVERALKEQPTPVLGISYRKLAQTLGTEWGRALRPDLWLVIAQHRAGQLQRGGDHVVLCDVRFHNEAAWLKDAGGHLIRIEREVAAPIRSHESERYVDDMAADYVIRNDSSLGALEHRLDTVVARIAGGERDGG